MIKPIGYAAALFIVAFGLGVLFSTLFDTATITSDAVQYDRIAQNIAEGNGFSLDQKAPFKPTMFREPLYPYFLSVIYKYLGYNRHIALITQSVINGISSVLTLALGMMLFSRRVGILAGLFTAINITLANFCAYLLTETLFIALLLSCVLSFYSYLKSERIVFIALGSFFAGLCALTKAGSLFLIVFILLAILVYQILRRNFNLMRFVLILILSLGIVVVSILPWSMRNKRVFNTYSLTYRIGVHLYSRATKVKDNIKMVLITSVYNFSEFLGKRIFPEAIERPNEYLYLGLWQAEKEKERYVEQGFTPDRADKEVLYDALDQIRKNPMKYIFYTPVEGIKLLSFSYVPVLNEDFMIERVSSVKNGTILLSTIRAVFKIYGLLLFIFSIFSIVRYRANIEKLLLVILPILYFGSVYSLTDAYARYFVVFIPFFIILTTAFFMPLRGLDEN